MRSHHFLTSGLAFSSCGCRLSAAVEAAKTAQIQGEAISAGEKRCVHLIPDFDLSCCSRLVRFVSN
jgi:hypothetical protein